MASFWNRLFGGSAKKSMNSLDLWKEIFGGSDSKAGQRVTIETALRVATVLACARVIAEGLAQVPLKLFEESADGRARKPAKDHLLYDVLHRKPNPWQTSFEFFETLALHAVLCGSHYSFKNVVGGKVVELIPFQPGQVTVKRDDATYALTYTVRGSSGATMTFPQAAIWHVRGPSWDSYSGLDVVRMAREAIGLAMAIEEQQASFYHLGARPSGAFSIEGTIDEAQYKKLREWIDKEHAGTSNAWRPMIFDRAAKWTQFAMSGVDAQTLEQRKYQVEEICRAIRVMPIMVGYSDKAATYASAEQMFLAHVVHTMAPWYRRVEMSIDSNLLTDADRKKGIYAKFVVEGLLRGALKDTAEYLARLVLGGIITRNEARAKLEYDAIDGLDEPLTPTNMAAGSDPAPATPPPAA